MQPLGAAHPHWILRLGIMNYVRKVNTVNISRRMKSDLHSYRSFCRSSAKLVCGVARVVSKVSWTDH